MNCLGVFDVDTAKLIEEVSEHFRQAGISQPAYADFVKTGMHAERSPQRADWYFVRMASILYRIFKEGTLGTGSLRTYYGGRKNRGVKRHHHYKAGGKIIRNCLQELEKQGLVKKAKKGREITGKGQKLLNEKAKIVLQKFPKAEEKRIFKAEKILPSKDQPKAEEKGKQKDGRKGKEKQEKEKKK